MRGGARIGAGQKKRSLSNKIAECNSGKRKLTVLDFTANADDLFQPCEDLRGVRIVVTRQRSSKVPHHRVVLFAIHKPRHRVIRKRHLFHALVRGQSH